MQRCVASAIETVHLTINQILKKEEKICGIRKNRGGKKKKSLISTKELMNDSGLFLKGGGGIH